MTFTPPGQTGELVRGVNKCALSTSDDGKTVGACHEPSPLPPELAVELLSHIYHMLHIP